MGPILQSAAIVTLAVVAALLGLLVVRRRVPIAALSPHTAVASAVYATLGVVYGVILGQVVVAAWGDFEDARSSATAEAASLLNLYRLAEGFPSSDRDAIQQAAVAYGRAVVDQEWPAMARRQAPSPAATAAIAHLYQISTQLARGPESATDIYAATLDELDELDGARGERLLASQRGLPTLMWVILVAGGVTLVGFTYLFGVENGIAHALMLIALTAGLALLLILVRALDAPFREPVHIPPDSFQRVLRLAAPPPAQTAQPPPFVLVAFPVPPR